MANLGNAKHRLDASQSQLPCPLIKLRDLLRTQSFHTWSEWVNWFHCVKGTFTSSGDSLHSATRYGAPRC